VPVHDQLPSPPRAMKRRFWRIFRLLLLLSAVIAAIAVALVARGDTSLHINMLIATALGVGFTVLLGTSLMTLVFMSADSGHDDAVAAEQHKERE
jgi:peptidoglycan/LPS O-acetylase OafA/YrhL